MFGRKPESGSTVLEALKRSDKTAFEKAIDEVHKAGGGKVSVMKRENVNAAPGEKKSIDITEVVTDPGFFETVLSEYKDGIYTFMIYSAGGNKHSEHHFGLGDIQEKKAKKKKKESEDGDKPIKGKDIYLTALVNQNTELMKMVAEGKNGNGGITPKDMMDFGVQLAGLLQGAGGSSSLDDALAIIQISQSLQPQVQQEDSTTAIVQAIMPLVGSFIAKKQGIAPGNVDPALLQQVGAAVANQVQGAPTLQPPGGPTQVSAVESGAGLGSGPAAAPSPAPAPSPGTQEYFMERFLNPFRQDVIAGVDDDELAYQIVSMIQYARDRMPGNPPLIVADFVVATSILEHDAALKKFFAALPELSNLKQKQEGIKSALIRMFTTAPQDGSPVGEVEEANVILTDIVRDNAEIEGTEELQDHSDGEPTDASDNDEDI